MKGSKEGKGDGGRAAGPALFPRLHVAETKKAGPRGPPRNKMALYEQLTIVSHRFKPTPVPLPSSGRAMNGSMTTPTCQPQVCCRFLRPWIVFYDVKPPGEYSERWRG
jgi:EARLY FLOWERING 3 protein